MEREGWVVGQEGKKQKLREEEGEEIPLLKS